MNEENGFIFLIRASIAGVLFGVVMIFEQKVGLVAGFAAYWIILKGRPYELIGTFLAVVIGGVIALVGLGLV